MADFVTNLADVKITLRLSQSKKRTFKLCYNKCFKIIQTSTATRRSCSPSYHHLASINEYCEIWKLLWLAMKHNLNLEDYIFTI